MQQSVFMSVVVLAALSLGACESFRAEKGHLGYAMAAPLRDLNIGRSKIPVLLTKLKDPYGAPLYQSCEGLLYEVQLLERAIVQNTPNKRRDASSRAGQFGNIRDSYVSGASTAVMDSVMPWRSPLRQLTGAAGHAQNMSQANKRAQARSAYLLGLGRGAGCRF